jgi:hypothetical protein
LSSLLDFGRSSSSGVSSRSSSSGGVSSRSSHCIGSRSGRLIGRSRIIIGERIGGRLAHAVALLAECRNPLVAAVLLTDRTGPAVDELFDLMPSLVGILGRPASPVMVTQVVIAAVANMASDTVRGRLAARWAAADRAGEEETATPAVRFRATPVPATATNRRDELWHDDPMEADPVPAALSPAEPQEARTADPDASADEPVWRPARPRPPKPGMPHHRPRRHGIKARLKPLRP